MADQVLRRDRDDSSVSEFLTAAEGVEQIDTTGLDIEDVVEKVLMLVAAAEAADETAEHGPAEPAPAAPVVVEAGPTARATRTSRRRCARACPTTNARRRGPRPARRRRGGAAAARGASEPPVVAVVGRLTSASPRWSTASGRPARPSSRTVPA